MGTRLATNKTKKIFHLNLMEPPGFLEKSPLGVIAGLAKAASF
jgi:hypothetical protein